MRMVYSLLYIFSLALLLPVHLLKRPPGLRARWLRERFGFVPSRVTSKGDGKRPAVWIHAVSVGEAMAARPLIERLRAGTDIIVSTVTDTGQKVVRDFISDDEACIYVPFDNPAAVKKTAARIRPDMLVIMETELWPNLLETIRSEGIPIVIVNGRISDGSFSGYRKIGFFMKGMLGMVDFFCMQTLRDAEKITALGASEEKVLVTGNLKFDITPPADIPPWCEDLGMPVIVAGSTHEGEEEIILDAFNSIKESFSGATLVIAPRHPERFAEVEGLLRERGYDFARKSDAPVRGKGIVLLDTIGELSSVYGCADVCIIGGSLIPRGGHNLFEPAYWSKPVVCGPHMENFPLARDFFKEGAAVEAGADDIDRVLQDILSDPVRAGDMGRRAKAMYIKNSGAVLKTLEVINGLLANTRPGIA